MNSRLRTLGLLVLAASLSGAAAQTTPPSTSPAPVQPAPTTPAQPAPAQPAAQPAAAPRPAANYIALGLFYNDQGNYDQAYVAFRAASEIDPSNTEALLLLGRAQLRLRLYAPSVASLKRLITLDPRNVAAYTALSQAYLQQYIGTSDRQTVAGNLTEALRVLTSAETVAQAQTGTDRNLNLSKVWNERGYVYKLQGDAARSIEAFKQASSLNPDNAIILYNLGDMYYATGNLPMALDYLQQAVIADPRDPYNRAYYAKLLALSGNLTTARPEAAQAAKLAPTNAYAVGQYGVVSYLSKDAVTARAQLTQAIKLDPLRYPEFYYYLGRLSLDGGDLRAARDNLTRAVVLGSNNAEYAYYLGLSYERGAAGLSPDRLKARANYEQALRLSPSYRLAQEGLNRVR
ncbi:tetratricopeptide repeat protein [Deinococcus navajonensis]|uniref:Tetratricopeptide repeat protein n=1 Tax=Deinococcus navajonensis TaxID=309884 RepID=A0ABV8XRX8_9DEIO